MSRQVLCRLIWLPSAFALLATLLFFMVKPPTLTSPGPLTAYKSSDNSIKVKYPNNWTPKVLQQSGADFQIRFVGGNRTAIRFSTDLAGSLMADIDRSSGAALGDVAGMMGQNTGAPKSALDKQHDAIGQVLAADAKNYADYAEEPATAAQIAGAEGRITRYTYKDQGMIDSQSMVGVRATAILGERRLKIMANCPVYQEKEVMPVFMKMIASLSLQQGGAR